MNKITLALGAGALALAGAIAGSAHAQQAGMKHDGHTMPGPMGNAPVTRAEAETKAGAMFDRMDANHDGKLDRADRTARIAERFDRMDANHDGSLSKAEFVAAHEQMMGRPGEDRGEHAMGQMHRMMGMRMAGEMMHGMDADHDRTITRAEFVAGALKRFDAADADHDGKVTPEERRAAMRARMGQMRRPMNGMTPPPAPPK